MASAILPALRNTYPGARIAWLIEPVAAPLLDGHPLLDRVIRWPRNEWLKLLTAGRLVKLCREIVSFVRMLRAERFDIAFDLQGLFKSGIWTYLSGAPERIGLRSSEGSRHLMTRVIQRGELTSRIGSEYLRLANEMGFEVRDFPMSVPATEKAKLEAGALLRKLGIRSPFIVICPFTTRPQKHWFDAYWIGFSQQMQRAHTMPIVMLGGPGDKDHAARLHQGMPFVHNLAGKTTLPQTVALISQASGLLGLDTGLTHMGIAHGIPTVALFGSTRPYDNTARANATVLFEALPCAPCRRRPICAGAFTCMAQLTPDRALLTLQKMMSVL
ncbi:MAG: glycosyltransferase family 9 protein [Pedosphaera sp.]|nr:glycosyltransferase family 9 protein [Pedosphaera sp.]